MTQFFSVGLMLVARMAMGPSDPVGIDDGSLLQDIEPGPRQVSIELSRWEALKAMAELEDPVEPAPKPWASERQVLIERSPVGVRILTTWQIETIEAGWLAGPLVGPMPGMRVESATWRGRPVSFATTPTGEEIALKLAAGSRGELKLVVFVTADQLPGGVDGTFDLWLMPAVRGEVRLGEAAPEGRVPELVVDGQGRRRIDDRFWAGESQLTLTWVDAASDADRSEGPLSIAQTAMGLTFADGEVRGRAHVSWLLRRGQLDKVSIDTAGLGRDLELTGPNVHAWSRSGDRIDIELKEPAEGRIDVELRWTQGLPSGAEAKLPAPRIMPGQAYRSESFMQLARDGEFEILPKLSGWAAVALAELPDWAGGYIQGTATASFRREGEDRGASFDLLRFVPLSGPPLVIDVANYEVATTDEGRSLVQARYDVRNERASHLRLELPAGSRMLGVRVNGETVTPTREAGSTTAWRIPLVRSLESVKGALSFPVEVIFIGEADPWERKEKRELPLPTLDAPVAVSRVRLYLPPRYANRVDLGDHHRVGDFSEGEGITYGLGMGAGAGEVAQADELYRDALSAWMDNDFRQAQSSLDDLGKLGASNANIEGLQANLDLVQGRGGLEGDTGGGQSAVVARRIKDQARRRAADDEIVLLEKAKEAEQLEAQGQYGEAEKKLAEAQELGDRLALLEQSESKEQAVYNQALSSSSERIADKKKRKTKREGRAKTKNKKKERELRPQTKATKAPASTDTTTFGNEYDADGDADDDYDYDYDYDYKADIADAGPINGEIDAPPPVEEERPPPPPMPEEPLEPELMPEPEPEPRPDNTITLEELESLPIGSETSRDFTAVVDMEPAAHMDRSSRARSSGKRGRKGKGGKAKPAKPKPSKTSGAAAQAPAPPADPNAALAGPVAVASAVSVHIPAIGEAVLYQHMLLPEGEALAVHLEARRHRAKTSKSK